jgi:hypothetical protein
LSAEDSGKILPPVGKERQFLPTISAQSLRIPGNSDMARLLLIAIQQPLVAMFAALALGGNSATRLEKKNACGH